MAEKISITASVLNKLRTYKSADKQPFCGLMYGLRSGEEALVCGYYSFEKAGAKSFLSQFDEAAQFIVNGTQPLGFFLKSPQAFMHSSMLKMSSQYFDSGSLNTTCFNGHDIYIAALMDNDEEDKKYFLYKFNAKSQHLESVEGQEATKDDVERMRDRFTLFHVQAKLPVSIYHTSAFEDKRLSIQHSINQLANQLANQLTIFKLQSKQRDNKEQKNNKEQSKQKQNKQNKQKQNKQNKQNENKQNENKQNDTKRPHQNKHLLIKNTYKHTNDEDDTFYNDDDDDNGAGNNSDDSSSQGEGGSQGEEIKMVDIADVINVERIDLNGYKQRVAQVQLLLQTTGSTAKQYYLNSAPVLYHDHLNLMLISLTLPLDVAVLVGNDDDATTICTHFVRAINKQLKEIADTLYCFSRSSVYYIPKPHHYTLSETIITVFYPEGIDENQLKETRKKLHDRFLIPLSSPFFKRSNHLPLSGLPPRPYLLDVHVGLDPSKVKGKVTLVQGSYEYRHYMQDRCNDDGWGCAYRSLQTIVSWLNLQGFTEKSVPTHLQTQQALVEVGDKTPSFLSSKKWIGSTEVSYVLDHLYSVQCRICHVSSGSEMHSKVREIAHHFETEGSPIMIGGGVLAHIIIGVEFNEETGKVSYLILDPHYTGLEDLKTIQDKGWCGWKGDDFWQKNSFYNMCMPIKPALY